MTSPTKVERPLSPHLSIYKPQLTSVLSILHRITGIALIFSLFLVIFWFVTLSLGTTQFDFTKKLFDTIFIRAILSASVWALWYHTCTGIRHLIWDFGYGLEVESITSSSLIILTSSSILTLVTLYLGWTVQ